MSFSFIRTAASFHTADIERVDIDRAETMDWRALSKSRSRSRAPDMMDWRAQSRSRSRAPEFRTSMAPPAVDSTPATANFSRFFGDSGVPSSTSSSSSKEMPPPPRPSTSTAPSSDQTRPSIAPLTIPTVPEDSAAALAELASSLGLSPQDQAQLFGSASARFDGHSLMDLPSPTNGLISPPTGTNRLASPGPLSPPQSTFAFQQANTSEADPNLAAIESALNQLINLQTLASSPSSTSSPQSNDGNALQNVKSPSSTFAPSPLANSTELPASHSRSASGTASQAQRHLQQFMTVRSLFFVITTEFSLTHLIKQKGTSPPVDPSRRTSASTSSAYGNAAALASSTRPFAFGNTSTSPSASGISLARPSELTVEGSHPTSPHPDQPPFVFPSSAPSHSPYLGSPNSPLFPDGADSTNLLHDYFLAQHDPSSFQSFASGSGFGSLPAPTHVDPSQLLHSLETPYGSAGSSWGINPQSFVGSPNGTNGEFVASPPTTASAPSSKSRLSVSSSGGRSSSTSNLSALSSSLPSSSKTKSAPTSRVHSRSNTVSLPPPIQEGKPFDFVDGSGSGDGLDESPDEKKVNVQEDDGVTRCLNCSTSVRFFFEANRRSRISFTDGLDSTYRILLYGVVMQRESLCATPAVSSAICMELIVLLVSTPV